jgi:hypothetical protein
MVLKKKHGMKESERSLLASLSFAYDLHAEKMLSLTFMHAKTKPLIGNLELSSKEEENHNHALWH